ncbi:MAG: L-threonylcarbamoyladenylate synthase [Patescibacteria group bacterium]|jgi:L-threonylcarbamoyladenylate synthase
MKTIILNQNNTNQVINNTISALKSNGLVVFPSDTVYGLLCDATNEPAVKKLITFKNRPAGKPISVFSNLEFIDELVKIKENQKKLIREIVPGPFTFVFPSKHKVNKLLESESGTLGIRIPMYQHIKVLVNQFKKPITATSANLAGSSPHYSIKSLLNELSEKQKQQIDLIVDAGELPRNKPSTVVDLSESDVQILRQGDISFSNKSKTYVSKTSDETKEIAKQILKKIVDTKNKPLVFIIEGEMGVGKTVFVKGIGEQLGINNIISPTFVIYYEYDNFYHFDLYQIEDKSEFKDLGIEKLLKPGNILCFEWGEKAGEIINILKEKSKIVYIRMKYINEREREIIVNV